MPINGKPETNSTFDAYNFLNSYTLISLTQEHEDDHYSHIEIMPVNGNGNVIPSVLTSQRKYFFISPYIRFVRLAAYVTTMQAIPYEKYHKRRYDSSSNMRSTEIEQNLHFLYFYLYHLLWYS